ncbi:MAG TPA: sigma-70 family RNA polymerase sigma factor [Candidatus Acidoferrum sp.]|nr:sigma-70 family RNA polymerase sigma factor [Candidatus Acidoferrum sp.]
MTHLLSAIEQGDQKSAEELLPLVYGELRRLAAAKMARIQAGQTLQPTALVHEAYLRLVAHTPQKWDGRAHFFSAAAEAMRRILIENARRKAALRHGGGQPRLNIDEVEIASAAKDDEMLAVNEVLEEFAKRDLQKAELVKLRYFVGMTLEEAAEVLGISDTMAKRHWTYARAWLLREIRKQQNQ